MSNEEIDRDVARLAEAFTKTEREIESNLDKALAEIGIKLTDVISELSPIDTGLLKNSITWRLPKDDTTAVEVGTNVEYAEKVEFTPANYNIKGNKVFMPKGAQMFTQGLNQNGAWVRGKIRQAIGDAIK